MAYLLVICVSLLFGSDLTSGCAVCMDAGLWPECI